MGQPPTPKRQRKISTPIGSFVFASLLYALLIITHRSFRAVLYEIAVHGVNERIGHPGVRRAAGFSAGHPSGQSGPPSLAPPSFRWHFPDGRVRVFVILSLSYSKISHYFVKSARVFQSLVTKIFSIENIKNLREIVGFPHKFFCQKFSKILNLNILAKNRL